MRKEEAVANYFIILGLDDKEEYMTNLRLNKLMYFAQAWSLALLHKPLFQESIEAWAYGPVVPSIYREYKENGKRPIESVSPEFSIEMFSDEERELLSSVMAAYRKYSTPGLVDIAHIKDGPWDKAYNSNKRIIDQEDIRKFFSKLPPIKFPGTNYSAPEAGFYNESGVYVLPAEWDDEYNVCQN